MAARIGNVLRSRVELHVPYGNATDILDNPEAFFKSVLEFFKGCFGNSSIEKSASYAGETGVDIVYIIWAACSTLALEEHLAHVVSFANQVAKELNLEFIVLVVNNSYYHLYSTE